MLTFIYLGKCLVDLFISKRGWWGGVGGLIIYNDQCILMYIYVYMYIYIFAHIYISIYVDMYICICVLMYPVRGLFLTKSSEVISFHPRFVDGPTQENGQC